MHTDWAHACRYWAHFAGFARLFANGDILDLATARAASARFRRRGAHGRRWMVAVIAAGRGAAPMEAAA
jgi:hypothetical protein